jgi:hypothetical protein
MSSRAQLRHCNYWLRNAAVACSSLTSGTSSQSRSTSSRPPNPKNRLAPSCLEIDSRGWLATAQKPAHGIDAARNSLDRSRTSGAPRAGGVRFRRQTRKEFKGFTPRWLSDQLTGIAIPHRRGTDGPAPPYAIASLRAGPVAETVALPTTMAKSKDHFHVSNVAL